MMVRRLMRLARAIEPELTHIWTPGNLMWSSISQLDSALNRRMDRPDGLRNRLCQRWARFMRSLKLVDRAWLSDTHLNRLGAPEVWLLRACVDDDRVRGPEPVWPTARWPLNQPLDSESGRTILFRAVCEWDDRPAWLVSQGADLHHRDAHGQTVLHWAATLETTNEFILLCRLGARWDARDHAGRTPVDVALRRRHVEPLLALVGSGLAPASLLFPHVEKLRDWAVASGCLEDDVRAALDRLAVEKALATRPPPATTARRRI